MRRACGSALCSFDSQRTHARRALPPPGCIGPGARGPHGGGVQTTARDDVSSNSICAQGNAKDLVCSPYPKASHHAAVAAPAGSVLLANTMCRVLCRRRHDPLPVPVCDARSYMYSPPFIHILHRRLGRALHQQALMYTPRGLRSLQSHNQNTAGMQAPEGQENVPFIILPTACITLMTMTATPNTTTAYAM